MFPGLETCVSTCEERVGGEIGAGGGGTLGIWTLDEDLWETISQENITGHFPHMLSSLKSS